MDRIQELRRVVEKDPGSAEFVELAQLLSDTPQNRVEAREICFRGLKENPRNTRGRLTLARLFYLDGLGEFSVRELVELRRYVEESDALDELIAAFGEFGKRFAVAAKSREGIEDDGSDEPQGSKVTAELDLDADFADLLEDIDEE